MCVVRRVAAPLGADRQCALALTRSDLSVAQDLLQQLAHGSFGELPGEFGRETGEQSVRVPGRDEPADRPAVLHDGRARFGVAPWRVSGGPRRRTRGKRQDDG